MESAAVPATTGAASGDMANLGSKIGTELGSRHRELPPPQGLELEQAPSSTSFLA